MILRRSGARWCRRKLAQKPQTEATFWAAVGKQVLLNRARETDCICRAAWGKMKRCTEIRAGTSDQTTEKRPSSAPSIMKYGKGRWLSQPPDLGLTYTTPRGQQRSQMALPHYRKKKKIATNIDDRAHFRHNEIKLKELRAIKLPSGIMAMPTIGLGWDKKKINPFWAHF